MLGDGSPITFSWVVLSLFEPGNLIVAPLWVGTKHGIWGQDSNTVHCPLMAHAKMRECGPRVFPSIAIK